MKLGISVNTNDPETAWKNGYWSIMGRIQYSLITLAAVVFIGWAIYWNLLGFRF